MALWYEDPDAPVKVTIVAGSCLLFIANYVSRRHNFFGLGEQTPPLRSPDKQSDSQWIL